MTTLTHDPVALARAFLAMDGAPAVPLPAQRSAPRALLAAVAACVLAFGTPMLWAVLPADETAATAPPKVGLLAEADDAP